MTEQTDHPRDPVNAVPEARASRLWKPAQRHKRLKLIEADIATLMRKLAEAEAAGREKDKKNLDQVKRSLLALLDVIDAFERVFGSINAKKDACTPQMNIWVGNFRTVYRLLKKFVTEQGVTPVENLDLGFDPHWHEAEQTIYDPARTDGTIVEEVKKGYLWNGKELLRRARVVVSTKNRTENGTPEPPSPVGTPDAPPDRR